MDVGGGRMDGRTGDGGRGSDKEVDGLMNGERAAGEKDRQGTVKRTDKESWTDEGGYGLMGRETEDRTKEGETTDGGKGTWD
jgi:hypothetical protein